LWTALKIPKLMHAIFPQRAGWKDLAVIFSGISERDVPEA
jgi:hypothetical protein